MTEMSEDISEHRDIKLEDNNNKKFKQHKKEMNYQRN